MPPNFISLAHVEQGVDADCLPACVDMVLSYIGRRKPRWRLHRILKTNLDVGTPFHNIRHLNKLDVTVRYYERTTFQAIKVELDQHNPCIVPVLANEFPHWGNEIVRHAVVIVGMDKQTVWIHDPATPIAPLPISIGEFDLAWFGMNERLAVILPK